MRPWNGLLSRIRPTAYARRDTLVLLNGLAEQSESWYKNRRYWGRFFDICIPNILVYDGPAIHARAKSGQDVTVDYLVEELHTYVTRFVQTPKVHLVASSLGGKVAVAFAARYPDLVNRLVLLCPSGMGDEEQLPIIQGVVKNDWPAVVKSVFYRPRFVNRDIVKYYKSAIENRRWKAGLIRTVNGTKQTSVRPLLPKVTVPTLLVTGEQDQICCPKTAAEAVKDFPDGHFVSFPKCGHAPQIEKARKINRLVVHFLTSPNPSTTPGWLLASGKTSKPS
ncbi:MAG: alpha/beta fold hydrolase [Gemmataceae bacterium]